MAKIRKISLSALNIVLPPPHRAERYIELFKQSFALTKKKEIRGDWIGLIGDLKVEEDPVHGLLDRGEFYKYIELDQKRSWYNVARKKRAKESAIDKSR